jgi:chloramphenicol O-acetyltransferase type A
MPQFLDLDAWPRRAAFDHFRRLEQPFFSLCASVDVTALPARAKAVPGATLFLAYHHAALRASNAVEPFRYRLQQGRVTVHERIDGSTTVLCADESIGFATLPFEPDFADFVEAALPQVADAKQAGFRLEAAAVEQAQIHMTTIPWLAFTSFTHARSLGGEDSVPKLAFGKIEQEGLRLKMPVAVEVHHALIDGLHVGRFFEAMQDALDE